MTFPKEVPLGLGYHGSILMDVTSIGVAAQTHATDNALLQANCGCTTSVWQFDFTLLIMPATGCGASIGVSEAQIRGDHRGT